jgi:hypothetical protein
VARQDVAAAQIMELAESQPLTVVADSADLVWTDSDSGDGMQFTASGKDILLVRNDEVSAQTVTITTADDDIGRSGEVDAYSVGAGEIAVFGMFNTQHWRQTDGMVYVDMSDDGVQIIVVRVS